MDGWFADLKRVDRELNDFFGLGAGAGDDAISLPIVRVVLLRGTGGGMEGALEVEPSSLLMMGWSAGEGRAEELGWLPEGLC